MDWEHELVHLLFVFDLPVSGVSHVSKAFEKDRTKVSGIQKNIYFMKPTEHAPAMQHKHYQVSCGVDLACKLHANDGSALNRFLR